MSDALIFILGFLAGVAVGSAVVIVMGLVRSRREREAMRESFLALAGEALDANSRRLADQAGATLDGKKQLIDQSVQAVSERLGRLQEFLQRSESDRKQDFGRLSQSVSSLATATGELHAILASTKRRGAWGERMAEDVLRLAGLQEGVNYDKQSSADASVGRADFTFRLPNDHKVNMDVKFPLERYKAYLDAETQPRRQEECKQLVAAVRGHVRDVSRRGYVDPSVPTVPYVIVFIPAEQIFSLVLEACPDLIDEALKLNIVLASPLTLYAMLAVIRQAAANEGMLETADEALRLFAAFDDQWGRYNVEFDKLGDRIDGLGKQYQLLGTTRTNMLQRQLDKIHDLRDSRGLPDSETAD